MPGNDTFGAEEDTWLLCLIVTNALHSCLAYSHVCCNCSRFAAENHRERIEDFIRKESKAHPSNIDMVDIFGASGKSAESFQKGQKKCRIYDSCFCIT